MLLFPEVQNKAHLALVEAIGRDRLLETDEIESIPYIHAVMREVLRWHPVSPIGMSFELSYQVHFLICRKPYHISQPIMTNIMVISFPRGLPSSLTLGTAILLELPFINRIRV